MKHIKPNPDQPKGARILQEQFLPVTNVSLLDPSLSQPTPVRLSMAWNPVSERLEQTRISELSGLELPLPARVDPYKDQKGVFLA